MKQHTPPTITGKSLGPGGSVLDHRFGSSDPYTLGVEEEYMLLDAESFDLVQHIDTVLAAIEGHELEPRINAGADAVRARDRDAGLPDARGRRRPAAEAARVRRRDRAREGDALRVVRNAPVLAVRAAADHGARPLPAPRRPDAVHRPPRADLRAARARRDRRPREGDPGRERAARAPRRSCSR